MCKDVRNSYIVHKLGIQRVPYDIRNYAVMRVFGKMSWGYYAGLRFPKTGHPVYMTWLQKNNAVHCDKFFFFIRYEMGSKLDNHNQRILSLVLL